MSSQTPGPLRWARFRVVSLRAPIVAVESIPLCLSSGSLQRSRARRAGRRRDG
jgi:hypothetical protein